MEENRPAQARSVFLYDVKFQKIKINLLDKAVLPEACSGMTLKFSDIGVQPDRLSQIKGTADIVQCPENLMRAGIRAVVAGRDIFEQMIVFYDFSPYTEHGMPSK